MNKASHVMIGRLLCRRLQEQYGIFLDERAFLFGSVLPDLSISFLLRPHFLKNHRCSIIRRIDGILEYDKQASAFFGRGYSIELGIICHYYADFFCFPHSNDHARDVASHVRYERDLYSFMMRYGNHTTRDDYIDIPPGEMSAEEVFERFLKHLEGYVRQMPSFENDFSQCMMACTELLVLLTSSTLAEQSAASELLYPA